MLHAEGESTRPSIRLLFRVFRSFRGCISLFRVHARQWRASRCFAVRDRKPISGMKRLRHIVSWYVALCVAFAGVVGISPLLHQVVEHGGRGPAHVHARIARSHTPPVHPHHHGPSERSHDSFVFPFPESSPSPGSVFVHGHPSFRFPTESLARLWHALGHFISGDPEDPYGTPFDPSHPDHSHHSLAQLMADGLVEGVIDLPRLPGLSSPTSKVCSPFQALLPNPPWDAQTAGRGPPTVSSESLG